MIEMKMLPCLKSGGRQEELSSWATHPGVGREELIANHTMASSCRVALLLYWGQGDMLTVPLHLCCCCCMLCELPQRSNALRRLWEVKAEPHWDGRASDCRKCGVRWTEGIENDGHIVTGIICYSIGTFLTSSCIRSSPEWWWSPSKPWWTQLSETYSLCFCLSRGIKQNDFQRPLPTSHSVTSGLGWQISTSRNQAFLSILKKSYPSKKCPSWNTVQSSDWHFSEWRWLSETLQFQ